MSVYIKQMLRTGSGGIESHQIVPYLKCIVPESYRIKSSYEGEMHTPINYWVIYYLPLDKILSPFFFSHILLTPNMSDCQLKSQTERKLSGRWGSNSSRQFLLLFSISPVMSSYAFWHLDDISNILRNLKQLSTLKGDLKRSRLVEKKSREWTAMWSLLPPRVILSAVAK